MFLCKYNERAESNFLYFRHMIKLNFTMDFRIQNEQKFFFCGKTKTVVRIYMYNNIQIEKCKCTFYLFLGRLKQHLI